MAYITVMIQDEEGNRASDAIDFPYAIIQSASEKGSGCIAMIDPYGDTVFNRLQIPLLRQELHEFAEAMRDLEQQSIIGQIDALAQKCQSEPHLYLKFIGD